MIHSFGDTYETMRSLSQFDSVCASSDGGPGLNRGEHIAGKSMLGTEISYAPHHTAEQLTDKALLGRGDVWLSNLRLDTAHYRRLPHTDQSRAIRSRNRAWAPSALLHSPRARRSPVFMLTSLQSTSFRPSGLYPLET